MTEIDAKSKYYVKMVNADLKKSGDVMSIPDVEVFVCEDLASFSGDYGECMDKCRIGVFGKFKWDVPYFMFFCGSYELMWIYPICESELDSYHIDVARLELASVGAGLQSHSYSELDRDCRQEDDVFLLDSELEVESESDVANRPIYLVDTRIADNWRAPRLMYKTDVDLVKMRRVDHIFQIALEPGSPPRVVEW